MPKKLTLAKRILKAVDYYDERNAASARTIALKVQCSYFRALTILKILRDVDLVNGERRKDPKNGKFSRFEYWKREQ